METKKLQEKCAKIVKDIDEKYKIKRDPHFCFTQLSEEIGELARAINMPKLRGKELDQKNLEEEFADVFVLLSALATMYDVDLESAVDNKAEELKKRHTL